MCRLCEIAERWHRLVELLMHVAIIVASLAGGVWAVYRLVELEMPSAALSQRAMVHEMDVRCAANLQIERCGFVARHLDSRDDGRVVIEQSITVRNIGELPVTVLEHKAAAYLGTMKESQVVWDVPPAGRLDALDGGDDPHTDWVLVANSQVAHGSPDRARHGLGNSTHCIRTLLPNEKCTTAAAFVFDIGDASVVGARSSFKYQLGEDFFVTLLGEERGGPCDEHRRSAIGAKGRIGLALSISVAKGVHFKYCAGAEIVEQIEPYVEAVGHTTGFPHLRAGTRRPLGKPPPPQRQIARDTQEERARTHLGAAQERH